MTLRAILRDGTELRVAPELGATEAELVANLTRDTLTGSALPLAGATLRAADGRTFRYADVNAFVDETAGG